MNFFKKAAPPPPEPAPVQMLPHELKPVHPFYPLGVEIVNYLANDKDVLQLLTTFAIGCAVILSITWLAASRIAPQLRATDKFAVLWFTLSKKDIVHPEEEADTDEGRRWFHTPIL